MKSPISSKFNEKSGKVVLKDLSKSHLLFREVHMIKSSKANTPLQRLITIRELICNGLNSCTPVKIIFPSEIKIRIAHQVQFPSRTLKEAQLFSRIVRVIAIIIENLQTNHSATRRDIYYQDVELFESQTNVDSIINLLCYSLGFQDYELNTYAAQKGLFCGNVTITFDNNVSQDYSFINRSQLIPRLYNVLEVKVPIEVKYCLVIEKEAVFDTLVNDMTSNNERVLVTGKGFPDQLTRIFVQKLSICNPNLEIIGIGDLDPYGLNIMKMFKLQCPTFQLSKASIMDFVNTSSVLNLPLRDFNMSRKMVNSHKEEQLIYDKFDELAKIELQRMMFLGKKAELNGIKTEKFTQNLKSEVHLVQYIDKVVKRFGL